MPWSSNAELPETAKNYSEECKSVFRRVANKSLENGDSETTAMQNAHAAAKNCESSKK